MEEEIKDEEIKKYVKELKNMWKPTIEELIVLIIIFIIIFVIPITIVAFAIGMLAFSLLLWNYQKKLAKFFILKDRKISELENKLKQLTEQQLQQEKVKRPKKK